MNRCLCAWVGSLLGCVALVGHSAGQTLPPASPPPVAGGLSPTPIPMGSQTAAALTPAMKDQIGKFITEQFTALSGTDSVAQANARKTFVGSLQAGSQPAYYSWYIQQWIKIAGGALSSNAALGVRLNIAIVTNTLAGSSQSLEIAPLVQQLLNDREPAVVLWGIKAAGPLMAQVMMTQNVGQSPLTTAIVAAVKKNAAVDVIGGFIAQDAYHAFAITAVQGLPDSAVKPKVQAMVPPILDILEYRISLHAAGAVQSPGAERQVATFLAGQYLLVAPASQKRMMQDFVTLETYVGQRAALYQNNKSDLASIREMIKYVTSAVTVIDPAAQAALGWLLSPPPSSTAADLLTHTKMVFSAITATSSFTWVTAPPAIPVIEPPPPTTPIAPTTPAGAPTPAK